MSTSSVRRLHPDEYARLQRLAVTNGDTMSHVLRELVDDAAVNYGVFTAREGANRCYTAHVRTQGNSGR